MHLALFLTPWILMYALSTMAMNHRELFEKSRGQSVSFVKEAERTYPGTFAPDAKPREIARRILKDLDMDGMHFVQRSPDRKSLTIFRDSPVSPRRIIYNFAGGKLTIEKAEVRAPSFLEKLHRRHGYVEEYPLQNAWAVSVDLAIVAMVFWVLSGLWMWWERAGTRRLGFLFTAAGLGLFAFFLWRI